MAILRLWVCVLFSGCYDLAWDPNAQNAAPNVRILAPSDGAAVGSPVALLATADDAEDGDLANEVVWSAGGMVLGVGDRLSAELEPGIYRVVASVSDSSGASGTDEIEIVVEE